jgi:hypothetical protein
MGSASSSTLHVGLPSIARGRDTAASLDHSQQQETVRTRDVLVISHFVVVVWFNEDTSNFLQMIVEILLDCLLVDHTVSYTAVVDLDN